MCIVKTDESVDSRCLYNIQQNNRTLRFGDKIGEGFGGVVYQDIDDPCKVIKQIKIDKSSDTEEATKEYELFKEYYGNDSASIMYEGGYCYIHMVKLPGETIDKIESFPDSAEEFFLTMINEMESKGIYHADLKPDNILYCAKENRFYPIDFSDTSHLRLTATGEEHKAIEKNYQYRINTILNIIANNMTELSIIDEEPNLGEFVGSGKCGCVYLARDDINIVFKKFLGNGNDIVKQAKIEASNFNRFYGASSAEVLVCNNNVVYIKMLRVPGIPLENITKGKLPREAELAFYELLSGLAKSKIMHDDLYEGNIHYDYNSNKFYPIDIGNQYYDYFTADESLKDGYNFVHHMRKEEILASITSNIKN